jgi:hypothetical protein
MNNIKKYIKNNEEIKELKKEIGARFNKGKIRYELIPTYALEELAKVYTYGAEKYDQYNWRKGLSWLNTLGSLLRHVYAWKKGEKIDSESNCHHLAMAAWNCFTLMSFEKNSIGIDDLPPQDLDLLNKKEKNDKNNIWNKLLIENKIDEYNGLKIKGENHE